VGTSRKGFLGAILRDVPGEHGDAPPERRDEATLATVVWAIDRGARIVRVHDARPAARAAALLEALRMAPAAAALPTAVGGAERMRARPMEPA
jgi:dihydropteroate synthase